jgi:hypothetical protein
MRGPLARRSGAVFAGRGFGSQGAEPGNFVNRHTFIQVAAEQSAVAMGANPGTTTMTLKKALWTVAAAVPLVIADAASLSADIGFGLGFSGPCYDYDPYDRYHLYGKYYPYNRAHCRGRSYDDDDDVVTATSPPAAPARCVRTNVKNFKKACGH